MIKPFKSSFKKAFRFKSCSNLLRVPSTVQFHTSDSQYNDKTQVNNLVASDEKFVAHKSFGQDTKYFGNVISFKDGVARVSGLSEVRAGEMVEFSNGAQGVAVNLETDAVAVVVLSNDLYSF